MTAQWSAGGGAREEAQDKAREVHDHPALVTLVRVGMAAHGVVYLVVAWLAAQVALGDTSGSASGQGALHQVARQPFGEVVLWIACVGFAALTLWKLFDAVAGHREEDGKGKIGARVVDGVKAVVYGALAVISFQTATGSSSGGGSTDSWTKKVMELPFGPALVVGIGVVLIGAACYSGYRGLSDKWLEDLEPEGRTGHTGTALTVLARTGYVARGVAFGIIGSLFVWAGFTHDPKKSGGLDAALQELRDAPLGPVLLLAIAVGLACYGVFKIGKGWHLREQH